MEIVIFQAFLVLITSVLCSALASLKFDISFLTNNKENVTIQDTVTVKCNVDSSVFAVPRSEQTSSMIWFTPL
jgi:hypothetical protein